jgi:hypothetical protein
LNKGLKTREEEVCTKQEERGENKKDTQKRGRINEEREGNQRRKNRVKVERCADADIRGGLKSMTRE